MIKFNNEVERDFCDYLVKQKAFNESAVCNCIEHLRKIQPLEKLITENIEQSIRVLNYLLEYKNDNFEKYNGWARATKNCTDEEIKELHRWMRLD